MQVRDGMSGIVLTVNPGHSLRAAACRWPSATWARPWSSTPSSPGPGILTERDVLQAIATGQDPDTELVAAHLSADLTFASPDWSLERAAEAMVEGGFRHLVVVDGGELTGVLSMRDIVRCWVIAPTPPASFRATFSARGLVRAASAGGLVRLGVGALLQLLAQVCRLVGATRVLLGLLVASAALVGLAALLGLALGLPDPELPGGGILAVRHAGRAQCSSGSSQMSARVSRDPAHDRRRA